MPNWVYNQIKIKSDNLQEYGYIKETLKDNGPDEVTDFSFNKVITRPADKEEDWYNWNISNWGTKWDASDVAFFERDNLLIYEFSTAWSPPEPVIVKLSKLFPNCDIEHIYEEEQGWGGHVYIKNGVINVNKTWDIPETHKDIIDRGGECGCSDTEKYYDDCFSYRASLDEALDEKIKNTAKILGLDWSGSYKELIEASSKL